MEMSIVKLQILMKILTLINKKNVLNALFFDYKQMFYFLYL